MVGKQANSDEVSMEFENLSMESLNNSNGQDAGHAQSKGKIEKSNHLIVTFGELLIDFVPTVGGVTLSAAPAFKKAPGGAPANVAVGVAKLGGQAAFIGKVGADEFGYMLRDVLVEYGVDCEGLRFDSHARTALAFVTLRHDGEREFMFYRNPSADMLLQESELDLQLIAEASIFHYGSISLISEPCRSAHLAAMKMAKKSGALLSYDPNLRLPLWPSPEKAREAILSIWKEADIVKVSDDEVEFLLENEDPATDEAAKKLWHPKMKLLLITEGSKGCRYYTEGFRGRVDGVKVDAIDTTGAGDAFAAGILSRVLKDRSLIQDEKRLHDALAFANACGAITTTERGAIPALPTTNSVLKLLRNSPNFCKTTLI